MNRQKIQTYITLSESVLSQLDPTHLKYAGLSSIREKFLLLPEIEDVDVESWLEKLNNELKYVISNNYSPESLTYITIPSIPSGLDKRNSFTVSGDYCLNV